MSNNNNTSTRVITPVGEAVSCFIDNPCFTYSQRGSYSITLAIPNEECRELCSQLDLAVVEAVKMASEKASPARRDSIALNPPYVPEYKEGTDEETGRTLFKFKQHALGTDSKGESYERSITKYDAEGNKLDLFAYSGTKLAVEFNAVPYYVAGSNCTGVSKWICSVGVSEAAPERVVNKFNTVFKKKAPAVA